MIKRFCRFSSALHEDGSYHKIFCDYVKLFARGGTGGAGAALFLSLYRNEFAGPSGGDGGNGGHVILQACREVKSLVDVKREINGQYVSLHFGFYFEVLVGLSIYY